MHVDPEVSRFGEDVPPLFWFRDPEGNKLMIVQDATYARESTSDE